MFNNLGNVKCPTEDVNSRILSLSKNMSFHEVKIYIRISNARNFLWDSRASSNNNLPILILFNFKLNVLELRVISKFL